MTTVVDPASLDPELFLPEPEPREVKYTVISVDDHLVEPPHMFEGRLPAQLQERAPKVVLDERGHEVWEFEGERHFQVGQNAVAGRRPETVKVEPFRFDQMRPGCYDPDARVRDMDLGGVWASLCFPSMITGFCGRVFSQVEDRELGFAVTRAWNDWMHEEWWGSHPERFIPLGITDLGDAERGAAEIRRNADRGFVTVSLPERPHRIGFPSIFDDHWELSRDRVVEKIAWIHDGARAAGRSTDDVELEMNLWLARITRTVDDGRDFLERMAAMHEVEPEILAESPSVLVGPVEQCVDSLRQRREELGFTCFQLDAGHPNPRIDDFGPLIAALS